MFKMTCPVQFSSVPALPNQSMQGRLPGSLLPPPETHIQEWGGGADPSSVRREEKGVALPDFMAPCTLTCHLVAVQAMQMNHARS